MKLLGWMHRKFRQNNSGVDPFKDVTIGNSCNCLSGRPSLHDQPYLPKRPSRDHRNFRKSFAGIDDATGIGVAVGCGGGDEDNPFEEDELFQGLLAIGTLGSEPQIAEHHRASVETITEKDTDVTADDLKLINEELEKVLRMDANDVADVSSGRNSHVSGGSTAGASAKASLEAAVPAAVCPLQGYLFGSPIELPPEAKSGKEKEQRMSLGELFQRSRVTEDGGARGGSKWERSSAEGVDKRSDSGGGGEKSGGSVQLMKKMLKRRGSTSSSSSLRGSAAAAASVTDAVSVAAETKLNKILHIFHRKVHPENSTNSKKLSKSNERYEVKSSNIRNERVGEYGDGLQGEQEAILLAERGTKKESYRRQKCRSNPQPFVLSGSDSNGNKEYWIKTDADYLVLEL